MSNKSMLALLMGGLCVLGPCATLVRAEADQRNEDKSSLPQIGNAMRCSGECFLSN